MLKCVNHTPHNIYQPCYKQVQTVPRYVNHTTHKHRQNAKTCQPYYKQVQTKSQDCQLYYKQVQIGYQDMSATFDTSTECQDMSTMHHSSIIRVPRIFLVPRCQPYFIQIQKKCQDVSTYYKQVQIGCKDMSTISDTNQARSLR